MSIGAEMQEQGSYERSLKGQFLKGVSTPKSDEHRKRIATALKRAWATKRKRMPVGSRWVDSGGYVRVKVVVGAGDWRLEHVLVVEKRIGRKLMPGEIVHHIDGDRQNNADDNLFLCRDHKHHMEIERQLKETFRYLLKQGVVTFSHALGIYSCH